MADAIKVDQLNKSIYLIMLSLLPHLLIYLCKLFNCCVIEQAALLSTQKGPYKFRRGRPRRRRYRPPPRPRHFNRVVSRNNCQRDLNLRPLVCPSAGIATDLTSWWPRLFHSNGLLGSRSHTRQSTTRVCALTSSSRLLRPSAYRARFDTDSFRIGVDNHASRCMANNPSFFREPPPRSYQSNGGGNKRRVSYHF